MFYLIVPIMKLKNYLLIVVLFISSIFSIHAQVDSKNNSEQIEPDPINNNRNGLAAVPFSIAGFMISRAVLAIGEAGNFPAAIKATTEYFPKN